MKNYSAHHKSLRRLAHLIAQSIYEEFIGPENLFLLQIAAVKREGSQSQIVLLDFDGQGEIPITEGSWSKTSPYFSLNGQTIFYTVHSPPRGGELFKAKLALKSFSFVSGSQGSIWTLVCCPTDRGMFATFSFESSANIYRIARSGAIMGKLTQGPD